MTMMAAGGIGSGVASSVARAAGAGRHQDADALVFHAVLIAVVFGLVFSIAVLCLDRPLFRALGGSGAALDAALIYARFIFLAALPIWIVNLLSAALRGIGNVHVPALVTLAGAVILVPLSPGFIFGVGPLRGFGVAGAGIAVTLYYCGAAIVMIRYLISGRSGLRLSATRLRWDLIRDILRVGVLSSVNALLLNLTVLLVTAAVGRFGVAAIGGYGTASRLDYVLIPILFGMGTAILTMVGTNVARRRSRPRETHRLDRRGDQRGVHRAPRRYGGVVSGSLGRAVQPATGDPRDGGPLPSHRRPNLRRQRPDLRPELRRAGTRPNGLGPLSPQAPGFSSPLEAGGSPSRSLIARRRSCSPLSPPRRSSPRSSS